MFNVLFDKFKIQLKTRISSVAATHWSLMLCLLLPAILLVGASVRAQAQLSRLLPAAAEHLAPEPTRAAAFRPKPPEPKPPEPKNGANETQAQGDAKRPVSAPQQQRSTARHSTHSHGATPRPAPASPALAGQSKVRPPPAERADTRRASSAPPPPPSFHLLRATSRTPLCEDVYVYIITDSPNGGDRATIAVGKRARGTPVTVGANVGDLTVIKIGQMPLGQPAVWLAEGDAVCRAMLFNDNPWRKNKLLYSWCLE